MIKQERCNKPTGSNRVLRGGGWYNVAGRCRSANRYGIDPSFRFDDDLGFRPARS
jgi:formylglycine-generating enzyme required for sulfatase activity